MKTKSAGTIKIISLLISLAASTAFAGPPPDLQPLPEPPPAPEQLQSGEAIPLGEPQITIRRQGDELVREYRLNGHLFAIKITPESGPPYYLIDADGDGDMESQFLDNNDARLLVPMWVIMRW